MKKNTTMFKIFMLSYVEGLSKMEGMLNDRSKSINGLTIISMVQDTDEKGIIITIAYKIYDK